MGRCQVAGAARWQNIVRSVSISGAPLESRAIGRWCRRRSSPSGRPGGFRGRRVASKPGTVPMGVETAAHKLRVFEWRSRCSREGGGLRLQWSPFPNSSYRTPSPRVHASMPPAPERGLRGPSGRYRGGPPRLPDRATLCGPDTGSAARTAAADVQTVPRPAHRGSEAGSAIRPPIGVRPFTGLPTRRSEEPGKPIPCAPPGPMRAREARCVALPT